MIKSIYVYGDSISLQWGKPFCKLIEGQYRYDRLGGSNSDNLADEACNGGSSQKMLEWAERLTEPFENTLLLFNCGLHDIKREFHGEISVGIEEYVSNLEKIITIAKKYFSDVIWISSTPVDDQRHLEYCKNFIRRNEDIIRYNQRASVLMKEWSIAVIDLYSFTDQLIKCGQDVYMDHVHMTISVSEQQAVELASGIKQYMEREEK